MTNWNAGDVALCVDDQFHFVESGLAVPEGENEIVLGSRYTVIRVYAERCDEEGNVLLLELLEAKHPNWVGFNSNRFVKEPPIAQEEHEKELEGISAEGG